MSEERFEFGANWRRFLETVDEERVAAAIASLRRLLRVETLAGRRFLDVGSGSGLFSLAAHRLGATVHSFDFDPQSVACTREIQSRFAPAAPDWTIEQGSALDSGYLDQLEPADVVYSWGVLHHTGEMWRAMDLVRERVASGGTLAIALYNDQGEITGRWVGVKRLYQRLPGLLRPLLVGTVGGVMLADRVARSIAGAFVRAATLQNPLQPVRQFSRRLAGPEPRGMHRWYDLVDWVGGWPFEVAKPEDVVDFLSERGFRLRWLTTCGGKLGCNEFVFTRDP
ncbi:MAG: class I SAM-dependent methyltransferase [Planctomycetaceae bacterium]